MNLKLNVLASFICYNSRVSGIDIKLKGAADWGGMNSGKTNGNQGPSSLSTEAPVTSSPTDSPTGAPVTFPPAMGSNDANKGGTKGGTQDGTQDGTQGGSQGGTKDGTEDSTEGADCINDAPTDTTNAVLIKFVDNPYGGVTGMT